MTFLDESFNLTKIIPMRITRKINLQTVAIILPLFFCSCNKQIESSLEKMDYSIGEVLISDDFSKNLSLWSIEGKQPQINDGQLEILEPAFSVVWFKPSLIGNYMIEFDFTRIPFNTSDNIDGNFGCFAMATDQENPSKFFAQKDERTGSLSEYSNLNLYYLSMDFNSKKFLQVMRYDKGVHEILNKKKNSSYQLAMNKSVHAKLLFYESIIEFYLNDECLFHYEDFQPYTKGNFGFILEKCGIKIDNFIVTHLSLP